MLALALGCTHGTGQIEAPPPPPGLTRLELKGNVIRYGDKVLRLEDRIEKWMEVLGPPSKIQDSRHWWFGSSVEVWVSRTADGRGYANPVTVNLGENGYPDGFVLQGITLNKGGPPLQEVMNALAGTETPLWGRGADRLYEDAYMKVTDPDGFAVTVSTELDCLPHLAPGSKGTCVQVIDELEIGARW